MSLEVIEKFSALRLWRTQCSQQKMTLGENIYAYGEDSTIDNLQDSSKAFWLLKSFRFGVEFEGTNSAFALYDLKALFPTDEGLAEVTKDIFTAAICKEWFYGGDNAIFYFTPLNHQVDEDVGLYGNGTMVLPLELNLDASTIYAGPILTTDKNPARLYPNLLCYSSSFTIYESANFPSVVLTVAMFASQSAFAIQPYAAFETATWFSPE